MRNRSLITGALLVFSGVFAAQCARQQAEAPAEAPAGDVQAVVSVQELMGNFLDPTADVIFNAVGTEVTEKGVVDVKPTTDEDWAAVMNAAITIAEGSNLLKIHPRPAVPAGYTYEAWLRGGEDAPELAPEEVQRRMDAQRGVWNSYADALKLEALKVADIVKAKDPDKLFQGAYEMNQTCERCHLAFWIPGDRPAVEEDLKKRATPGDAP